MSKQSTDNKMVYELINPIEPLSGNVEEGTINEIEFHKPTLGELKKHDVLDKDGQATKILKILSASCNYPSKILERLSWDDYQGIQKEVMDFLGLEAE